jgi:hypothetical protein
MKPANKTLRFKSFDEFVETAKRVPPSANDERGSRAVRAVEKDVFYGDSFDGAITLASKGWKEGAERALALRASIDGTIRDVVCARQAGYGWEVSGDFVDVGKFLVGEPECFVTTVADGECATGRVVRLVANVAASAAVTQESLFCRGAVVVAAIDILESLGHRVELTVARGTTTKGKTLELFVPVKSASQPLDIDRLAFCLCHPAFLRRLTWSVSEAHGFIPHETKPAPVETDDAEILTISEARRGTDFTQEQLLDEVKTLCERCGVSIG